jgi:hypothetical protein
MKDIPTRDVSLSLRNAMVRGILALAAPKRGQSKEYEHFL